jgi:hypothetical protein
MTRDQRQRHAASLAERYALADALDAAALAWMETHPDATWAQAYAFAELALELEPLDPRPRAERRRR